MIKLDLHTHSILSHDGGITFHEYAKLLSEDTIDCVAVTDHDHIEFAHDLHKQFKKRVIVGQEITTTQGEIIGLYLKESVPAQNSLADTIYLIHQQDGLVYIPHPFETFKKGISFEDLQQVIDDVDIIEIDNAKGYKPTAQREARNVVEKYSITTAVSSDAHSKNAVGSTYTLIDALPTRETLIQLLHSGQHHVKRPPLLSHLSPTINKLKKRIQSSRQP